jgi:hypothetical protein
MRHIWEDHAEGLAEWGCDVKLRQVLRHSQTLNGVHNGISCAGRGRLQPHVAGLSIYSILDRGANEEVGDIPKC